MLIAIFISKLCFYNGDKGGDDDDDHLHFKQHRLFQFFAVSDLVLAPFSKMVLIILILNSNPKYNIVCCEGILYRHLWQIGNKQGSTAAQNNPIYDDDDDDDDDAVVSVFAVVMMKTILVCVTLQCIDIWYYIVKQWRQSQRWRLGACSNNI